MVCRPQADRIVLNNGRRVPDRVAEQLVAPLDRTGDRLGVGIEEQLVAVEPVAPLGLVRSVDPVPIEGAGTNVGEIGVPHAIGGLGQLDRRVGDGRFGLLEQAQLDGGRVLREQGEVHPAAVPGGSEGGRGPRPDPHGTVLAHCGPEATPLSSASPLS